MMMTTLIGAGMMSLMVGGEYRIDAAKMKLANERLRSHIHARNLAGAVTYVMLDGEVVSNEAFGWSDLEKNQFMKRDSLFQVMSMTKPVTAAAVMVCVERGLIGLDDPIEKYLPKFKGIQVRSEDGSVRDASTRPTIRHLLSHVSGLASDDPGGISDEVKARMSLREYSKLLGSEPLRSDPGAVVRYSGVGFSTAAAIVEIASGRLFEEFVYEEIFGPLGMTETTFFLPGSLRSRLAQVYTQKGDQLVPFDHDRFRDGARFSNGAGGLYSTATDMAKFIQAFSSRPGRKFLSPGSVELMTMVQTGSLLTDGNDARGYGLGWSVIRGPLGQATLRSQGSFGHTGAFGTEFWHDPTTGLTVVFLAQTFFINEDARRHYSTMVNASLRK